MECGVFRCSGVEGRCLNCYRGVLLEYRGLKYPQLYGLKNIMAQDEWIQNGGQDVCMNLEGCGDAREDVRRFIDVGENGRCDLCYNWLLSKKVERPPQAERNHGGPRPATFENEAHLSTADPAKQCINQKCKDVQTKRGFLPRKFIGINSDGQKRCGRCYPCFKTYQEEWPCEGKAVNDGGAVVNATRTCQNPPCIRWQEKIGEEQLPVVGGKGADARCARCQAIRLNSQKPTKRGGSGPKPIRDWIASIFTHKAWLKTATSPIDGCQTCGAPRSDVKPKDPRTTTGVPLIGMGPFMQCRPCHRRDPIV